MLKKMGLLVLLGVLGFVATIVWSYSGAITSVAVEQKLVALSFDDGPNPPHTEQLLELLAAEGVYATFFPKGANVEAFPEAAQAMVAAGHEIGNHSYLHRPLTSVSKDEMLAEVERANNVIQQVMGVRPRLFRPPFAAQFIGLKRALNELGMLSVMASNHGSDWEVTEAAPIAEAVLDGIGPGSIVILHDGHGDVDDPHSQDGRAASVAATRIIIETLRKEGYRFVTVGDLLALSE